MLTGSAHGAPASGRTGSESRPGQLSPRQAIVAWLVAAFAMMFAGAGLHLASLRFARRSGDLAELADPKYSPLVHDPTWISLGTLVNELTLAAVLALWLWRVKPPLGHALPFTIPPPSSVLGALLLVFGLGPLAEACGALVQRLLKNDLTIANVVLSAAGGESTLEFLAVLVCLSLLPALIEESMFRGAVTAAFARGSRFTQVVVPALLFGVFHFEPTQVAGTIVLGLGFGLARVLSDSLWPGIIAHGLFNAVVMIGARFDNQAPDFRIRAGELLIGGVLAATGLLLLVRARLLSSRRAMEPEAPSPS